MISRKNDNSCYKIDFHFTVKCFTFKISVRHQKIYDMSEVGTHFIFPLKLIDLETNYIVIWFHWEKIILFLLHNFFLQKLLYQMMNIFVFVQCSIKWCSTHHYELLFWSILTTCNYHMNTYFKSQSLANVQNKCFRNHNSTKLICHNFKVEENSWAIGAVKDRWWKKNVN